MLNINPLYKPLPLVYEICGLTANQEVLCKGRRGCVLKANFAVQTLPESFPKPCLPSGREKKNFRQEDSGIGVDLRIIFAQARAKNVTAQIPRFTISLEE